MENRRTEILEHFQHVLREEGFEGASIAKIARRMGVNPSLLLHYFPSKEAMTVALVDYIIEKYETLGAERIREISDPGQRIDLLLDMVLGVDWISLVDSSAFYSCYYLSFRNARVKARLQKMYLRFRERILSEIETAMADGIVKKADPEVVVDFIISLVEGLAFIRNVSGGADHYIQMGAHFRQMVKNLLVREENTVTISSLEELLQFKQLATKDLAQMGRQVARLSEKVKAL